jgi:hypothetical protein
MPEIKGNWGWEAILHDTGRPFIVNGHREERARIISMTPWYPL